MGVAFAELGMSHSGETTMTKSPFLPRTTFPEAHQSMGNGIVAGDFASFDRRTRLAVVNHAVQLHIDALQESQDLPAQNPGEHLDASLIAFRTYVNNPEHYPQGALETIRSRYDAADAETVGKSMEDRVAARLAQFPNYGRLVTDMDGTVTEEPEAYLPDIPGSSIAEKLLEEQGREQFSTIFAKTWRPVLKHAPVLFEEAGSRPKIRAGVTEFIQNHHNAGGETTVISANFEPLVANVINRAIPVGVEVEVYAIGHDSTIATEKGALARHIAQQNPNTPLLYAGDGASDLPILDASDVIACFFALKGSVFEAKLKARNLPYIAFEDFTDIERANSQIQTLRQAYSASV